MISYSIGLLDDNPIITSGLKNYIDATDSLNISFITNQPASFLIALQENLPDVLIMDVIMDGVNGPELFQTVRKLSEEVIIVVFSDIHNIHLIRGLYAIGVNAFISKKENPDLLFKIINELLISDKKQFIPENLAHLIQTKQAPILLTNQEKTIANHIKNGLTNKEIASTEFISVNTVAFHKKQLFKKFNVRNIAELVREIIDQGFVAKK